jgi:hypothetical protein
VVHRNRSHSIFIQDMEGLFDVATVLVRQCHRCGGTRKSVAN